MCSLTTTYINIHEIKNHNKEKKRKTEILLLLNKTIEFNWKTWIFTIIFQCALYNETTLNIYIYEIYWWYLVISDTHIYHSFHKNLYIYLNKCYFCTYYYQWWWWWHTGCTPFKRNALCYARCRQCYKQCMLFFVCCKYARANNHILET